MRFGSNYGKKIVTQRGGATFGWLLQAIEKQEQHMSIKGEDYVRIRVGWILERRKTEGKNRERSKVRELEREREQETKEKNREAEGDEAGLREGRVLEAREIIA